MILKCMGRKRQFFRRLKAGLTNWRAKMTLGIWIFITYPALLAKVFFSFLFLGIAEELSTDQLDSAMALIRLHPF